MKPLGISHDNAHCEGDGCTIKNDCMRYILHLEAVENKMEYITYLMPTPKDNGKECPEFWDKN